MSFDKEAAQKQFEALGLDKKRVTDTLKNEKLAQTLLDVVRAGSESTDVVAVEKTLGNLYYAIATELPAGVPTANRDYLARAVHSGRIATRQQILAAFKHLAALKDAPVVDKDFDAACGVGVVVSRDVITEEVKAAIAKAGERATIGEVMKILKGVEALTWADQSVVSSIVKELKPAVAPAVDKKKAAAAAAAAPAPAAAKKEIPVLVENPSLPPAAKVHIFDCANGEYLDKRVRVSGWVMNAREARAGLVFCNLRDGTGCVQCVFSGAKDIANHALMESVGLFTRETSIEVTGTLRAFPAEHKASDRQPRTINYELQVDWWKLLGRSNVDIETLVTAESDVSRRMDYRHIALRTPKGFTMLTVRNAMMHAFRCWYQEHEFVEVTPPTLVETFCEGGSNLFKVDYFGTPAYLTQSSQLYLETVLPVVGRTFCILPSFRAEQSRTRRHLSEFTHLEGELAFIDFEDLLKHLEDIICDVCEAVMARVGDLVRASNPDFKVPKRPFRRMTYADAIKYCNEHGILNSDTGKPFVYGEDITEKPERAMTDMIGEPILMMRFPTEMKAFYMKKCPDNPRETESVDVLMPGVGEIVGGSMRISDLDELLAAYKRVGIDPAPYYWFTDQRKYGSVSHGGYGIGTERLLMWILNGEHIRDMCLYPRYIGRCKP